MRLWQEYRLRRSPWHKSRFQDAIEYLHQKASHRRFSSALTLPEAHHHRRGFARDLARLVNARRYHFSPATQVLARFDGKERALYRSEVLDAVVERVLSQWLTAQLESCWPTHLYSYRPGLSSQSAIRAFAAYVRHHQQSRPDPRTRGLWVLRRDIKSYGTAIPLDSRLWTPLAASLQAKDHSEIGMTLLRSFLPREFLTPEAQSNETPQVLEHGTPTGTPIQPTINNFYLLPLDKRVSAEPGFYARFGDDFIYASEDRAQAHRVSKIMDETLTQLGLNISPGKCEDLYFNGSGYQNNTNDWPSRTSVDLLGTSVSFTGSIRLRKDKARRLRRELAARMRSAAKSLVFLEPEQLVMHLGDVVRSALSLDHPLVVADAQALWMVVDDRTQFKELDRWLQRIVVELVLRRGIRGFRRLPPSRLYALGLPSLTAQRNTGRWTHGEPLG